MRPPRIGLNLLWMVPGVVGGSEEYSTRLLAALAGRRDPGAPELVVFANRRYRSAYPELASAFETVVAPVGGARKALRVGAENTWLAAEARRRRIAVVHHLGGIIPFLRGTPAMVTIHDLQPLAMPEHFSVVKQAYHRIALPHSVRRAVRIVTLTEHTRGDLVQRLGALPERVVVVPAGIEPPRAQPAGEEPDALRVRYGLGEGPLFLYPAITYPHKNHLLLLEAFEALLGRHPDAQLVLTGGAARSEPAVVAAIGRPALRGRVHRLGRIPRADVDGLYRLATALTFPSLFEGFGIPVLEAMGRGCPVVAADETALPEVVGQAGVLLPARDARAWSEAMARLVEDPAWRRGLADRGLERAASFDWATPASRLEEVYDEVLREVRG